GPADDLLDDLGPDLTGPAVDQLAEVALAPEDVRADLLDAARAQRIGLARESQLRERSLAALQQRRRSPLGLRRGAFDRMIESLHERPEALGRIGQGTGQNAGRASE